MQVSETPLPAERKLTLLRSFEKEVPIEVERVGLMEPGSLFAGPEETPANSEPIGRTLVIASPWRVLSLSHSASPLASTAPLWSRTEPSTKVFSTPHFLVSRTDEYGRRRWDRLDVGHLQLRRNHGVLEHALIRPYENAHSLVYNGRHDPTVADVRVTVDTVAQAE